MKYSTIALKILHELGIHKMYKGCAYILSCIDYIAKNEQYFTPITKILYVDVAKLHNTSSCNVERGIRGIIEYIWNCKGNRHLIEKIFGKHNVHKRPANTEFLMLLYAYSKHTAEKMDKLNQDYTFTCSICNEKCPFYKDIVIEAIEKIYL